jgi:hypothetical protein
VRARVCLSVCESASMCKFLCTLQGRVCECLLVCVLCVYACMHVCVCVSVCEYVCVCECCLVYLPTIMCG